MLPTCCFSWVLCHALSAGSHTRSKNNLKWLPRNNTLCYNFKNTRFLLNVISLSILKSWTILFLVKGTKEIFIYSTFFHFFECNNWQFLGIKWVFNISLTLRATSCTTRIFFHYTGLQGSWLIIKNTPDVSLYVWFKYLLL